ncbi:MAG: hypothetical protein DWH82_00385 [Planctomycetota bacterium]|nr:MAG: hypothetical protein DWH82_00385 [Planctomycetota bacterium]
MFFVLPYSFLLGVGKKILCPLARFLAKGKNSQQNRGFIKFDKIYENKLIYAFKQICFFGCACR